MGALSPAPRGNEFFERLLHAHKNAGRMADSGRTHRFGHAPAFAAELLDNDPVARLQLLPDVIEPRRPANSMQVLKTLESRLSL